MKNVTRDELLDLGAYEQIREHFRKRIIDLKRVRRVSLGPNMTVLFENHDTVLFQVQEMLRTERITAEKAIAHELETYNELVPRERELSATVFIEYPEREERTRMLAALAGVEDQFFIEIANERLAAAADPRPRLPEQTMAVQYIKFPLSAAAAILLAQTGTRVVIGVQHAAYEAHTLLSAQTLDSLRDDLNG
jgi:hypothetical protein